MMSLWESWLLIAMVVVLVCVGILGICCVISGSDALHDCVIVEKSIYSSYVQYRLVMDGEKENLSKTVEPMRYILRVRGYRWNGEVVERDVEVHGSIWSITKVGQGYCL